MYFSMGCVSIKSKNNYLSFVYELSLGKCNMYSADLPY